MSKVAFLMPLFEIRGLIEDGEKATSEAGATQPRKHWLELWLGQLRDLA